MRRSLLIIPFVLGLAACSSDSGGGGGSAATTYSISGTLDAGATATSALKPIKTLQDLGLDFSQKARTSCSDGKFYSVYCMSFTTPPVAAEGDVDCSDGGAFTVDGLPLDEPIYCVVRRYESASSTDGDNIGAIEIPAANLSGGTDTIVGGGDLTMAVTLGGDGSITATVTGETSTPDTSTADATFTAANMDGVWSLTCDSTNGGSEFSAGACKCFLGEQYYGAAGYANQDDCMDDSNGAGAAITQTVSLGIGIYIHEATAQTAIPTDGGNIPSGTDIKAISIWGTSGSSPNYVSLKTAGEGVTTLGGALSWSGSNPTTAIGWTTGNVTIVDGASANITVNVPALPADANIMDHTQWVTWIQSVVAAAETGGFACTWGPNDANAHNTQAGANLDSNMDCINQVMEALSRDDVGATLPRVEIRPYCDQNGCVISSDGVDTGNARNYADANAFEFARVEFDDWHLDYSDSSWANTDDYTTGGTDIGPASGLDAGIGISSRTRYVFEPLQVFPTGAGFRQRHENERHYECVNGAAGQNQVSSSSCNGAGFYQLECRYSEELAIKFMGTSAPFDVIFDSLESPVSARLYNFNGGPPTEVTGVDVLGMCAQAGGSGGYTFVARGQKQ